MRSGYCPACLTKIETRFLISINQLRNAPTFYTVPCVVGAGGTLLPADTKTATPLLKPFRDFEAAYDFIISSCGYEYLMKIEIVSADLPPHVAPHLMRHLEEDRVFDYRATEAANVRVVNARPQLARAA